MIFLGELVFISLLGGRFLGYALLMSIEATFKWKEAANDAIKKIT